MAVSIGKTEIKALFGMPGKVYILTQGDLTQYNHAKRDIMKLTLRQKSAGS